MDGDFRSDFSRDSYYLLGDVLQHDVSRLLWQQGRVILDAHLNGQTDILLRYLYDLASDLIGPVGGPADDLGFAIAAEGENLLIGKGHYYVDGILVSNADECPYAEQPYYDPDMSKLTTNKNGYLIYLDVWEHEVSFPEEEDVLIREVALGEGSPDTVAYAQIVWQVKAFNIDNTSFTSPTGQETLSQLYDLKRQLKDYFQSPNRGQLAAKAKERSEEDTDEACIISPASGYRRPENQLYRVEIHTGGQAWPEDTTQGKTRPGRRRAGGRSEILPGATFVVSRENSSVFFSVLDYRPGDKNTVTVTLDQLGRDDSRFALNKNDWVEIVDERIVFQGQPGPLFQVQKVDSIAMTVTLIPASNVDLSQIDPSHRLFLRLWNYQAGDPKKGGLELAEDGAAKVRENVWLQLEDGVQISFRPPSEHAATYRTGDYWLIPARTITGDVVWPQQKNAKGEEEPVFLPPHGVGHHYAPLAYITVESEGSQKSINVKAHLQCSFKSLVELSLPTK